jgi:hypothetical protein
MKFEGLLPKPRQTLRMGPVWTLEDIIDWALEHGREVNPEVAGQLEGSGEQSRDC